MTPLAHTPGPWDFACDSYGKVRHSKKACVFAFGVGHIDAIAARIPNWKDAVLIAAAPDLYAALSTLVRRIERDNLHTTAGIKLTAARTALAKAQGTP